MCPKTFEKKHAIALRKQGKSYNEILEKVPVAKSTLSLWLRDVDLSKRQKQKLAARKKAAQRRGGERRRAIRHAQTKRIHGNALRDIGRLTKRDLFVFGIALYWAEGSKIKDYSKSEMVEFANSDPDMVKLFYTWLVSICGVNKQDVYVRLHIHENHLHREAEVKQYWSKVFHDQDLVFGKTVVKKHRPKTKRRNTSNDYMGLVSLRVRKSTNVNRRIQGLIYGIINAQKDLCPVV